MLIKLESGWYKFKNLCPIPIIFNFSIIKICLNLCQVKGYLVFLTNTEKEYHPLSHVSSPCLKCVPHTKVGCSTRVIMIGTIMYTLSNTNIAPQFIVPSTLLSQEMISLSARFIGPYHLISIKTAYK